LTKASALILTVPLQFFQHHNNMIIWSGLGILIPIISIFAIIAGFSAASAMGQPAFGGGAGFFLAAILNWALWKMVYPKQPKVMADPVTGQQFVMKPNHRLFFIPARAWTWILALLVVPAIVLGITGERSAALDAQKPGFKEFTAANDLIGTNSSGIVHGNTETAKRSARDFSKNMKTMTEALFTGGSKKNLMTGGDFLTYCHESEHTIVFLCHVPSLRSYQSEESKSALYEISWACARNTAKTLYPEQKKKLVIGLRGISSYGSMQEGGVNDEDASVINNPENSAFYPAFISTAPQ
jgi:hypothetical protein